MTSSHEESWADLIASGTGASPVQETDQAQSPTRETQPKSDDGNVIRFGSGDGVMFTLLPGADRSTGHVQAPSHQQNSHMSHPAELPAASQRIPSGGNETPYTPPVGSYPVRAHSDDQDGEFMSPDESDRRRRWPIVVGTVALLVCSGAYVASKFVFPESQIAASSGEPNSSETIEPTPQPIDIGDSASVSQDTEPTPNASDSGSPSEDPSESPSDNMKPSKKPPVKPVAPTPLIKETSLITASVDMTKSSSEEVASVLRTTMPAAFGVYNATPDQFKNVPNRMGEQFKTIPEKYSTNSKEGQYFIGYDTEKMELLKEGSIRIPGRVATSVDQLNVFTPYGLFRTIPTPEEKKKGLKGQLTLIANGFLTPEELPWVVEKSKGKLTENGNVKRFAQIEQYDQLRVIAQGIEEKMGEEVVVVLHMDLSSKNQGEYVDEMRTADCFLTRSVEGKNPILFNTTDAMETNTDACDNRVAKASGRRAFVTTKGAGEVHAYTRISPDGGVKVLFSGLEYTLEQAPTKKR